jgi:hypothetical protein
VVGDLSGGDVNLNGIVGVDQRVWVADGTTVMCGQVWNLLWSNLVMLHLAQLVLQ